MPFFVQIGSIIPRKSKITWLSYRLKYRAPFKLDTSKDGAIKRLASVTIGDKLGHITTIFVAPDPIEFI